MESIEPEGVIYRYVNKKTGECYIGNTIHEKARASKFKDMNHPYAGRKMEDARRRYDFEYEVLTTIKSKDKKDLKRRLDEYEGYYIKAFNSCENGYNTGHGGNGTKGVKMPEEQKQKISKALKGKPKPETSEETRKKMSESHKGKKKSIDTRMKISNAMKGKKHSKTQTTKEVA